MYWKLDISSSWPHWVLTRMFLGNIGVVGKYYPETIKLQLIWYHGLEFPVMKSQDIFAVSPSHNTSVKHGKLILNMIHIIRWTQHEHSTSALFTNFSSLEISLSTLWCICTLVVFVRQCNELPFLTTLSHTKQWASSLPTCTLGQWLLLG